jgi:hypothetical protein
MWVVTPVRAASPVTLAPRNSTFPERPHPSFNASLRLSTIGFSSLLQHCLPLLTVMMNENARPDQDIRDPSVKCGILVHALHQNESE